MADIFLIVIDRIASGFLAFGSVRNAGQGCANVFRSTKEKLPSCFCLSVCFTNCRLGILLKNMFWECFSFIEILHKIWTVEFLNYTAMHQHMPSTCLSSTDTGEQCQVTEKIYGCQMDRSQTRSIVLAPIGFAEDPRTTREYWEYTSTYCECAGYFCCNCGVLPS